MTSRPSSDLSVNPAFPLPSLIRNLINQTHCELNCRKGTGADRHRPQQGRPNTLPEAPDPISLPRGGEARAHGRVLLLGAETVGLHLALDDVEGVAGEPEGLSRQTAVEGDLVGGDVLAVDLVAGGVLVHHVLEGGEPGAVGERLAPDGDDLAAVDAAQDALVGSQLADAVQGTVVEACGTVGLALQADADVLNGPREDRVGHAGEGARRRVLAVGERARASLLGVARLEEAAGLVEGAELDGDAGPDPDEGGEGALVEGQCALVPVD